MAAGPPWAGDGGWPHEFATTDAIQRADRTHAPARAVRAIQRGVLGRFVIVLPLSASDAGSEGKMRGADTLAGHRKEPPRTRTACRAIVAPIASAPVGDDY